MIDLYFMLATIAADLSLHIEICVGSVGSAV